MSERKTKNLPLEWIRVFEAAGRTGSFTQAAAEAGLSQAAVSQRIRHLESRIGSDLFYRQARGVTLTVDGEAWLPYVSSALQSLEKSAEDLFGKPMETLVISASTSITQLWLVPRLKHLSDAARFQISINTMNTEADFFRTNATIEIRYGNGHWPDRLTAPLYREVLTPLIAPELLSTNDSWQALPHIAVSGPRPGWHAWAARSGDVVPPIPRYRFDNYASATAAAQNGAGVILGSLPLCPVMLQEHSLVRLSDMTLEPDTGPWLTAKKSLPQRHWNSLVECFCQIPL
ncbi:MAG: LysR family transcriptional regulator [Granulosicoccus sp.]